jgi:hypothetical protein
MCVDSYGYDIDKENKQKEMQIDGYNKNLKIASIRSILSVAGDIVMSGC